MTLCCDSSIVEIYFDIKQKKKTNSAKVGHLTGEEYPHRATWCENKRKGARFGFPLHHLIWQGLDTTVRWGTMTPLGVPVVPLEKQTENMSFGSILTWIFDSLSVCCSSSLKLVKPSTAESPNINSSWKKRQKSPRAWCCVSFGTMSLGKGSQNHGFQTKTKPPTISACTTPRFHFKQNGTKNRSNLDPTCWWRHISPPPPNQTIVFQTVTVWKRERKVQIGKSFHSWWQKQKRCTLNWSYSLARSCVCCTRSGEQMRYWGWQVMACHFNSAAKERQKSYFCCPHFLGTPKTQHNTKKSHNLIQR